ncbi:MAG: hypothetical protein QM426_01130 [Euryarchaeota archaeon]|nr:hypothetical protein [Euryarchaeota archaeon]
MCNGEYPQILSLFTLESAHELEKPYIVAVPAINYEKAKKQRMEKGVEMRKTFSQIEGTGPEYRGLRPLLFFLSNSRLFF